MWYSIKSIYSGKGWIIPAYAIIAMLIIFGTPNVFMYVFLTIILYYVIRSILIEELISFAKEVKIRKKKRKKNTYVNQVDEKTEINQQVDIEQI